MWAIAGLLAGAGMAIIGGSILVAWTVVALVQRTTRRFRKVAVAGLALSLLGVVTLWVATRTWAANPAEDELGPIAARLRAAGAATICGDGDPGLGPDNFEPWAEEYLRVPADSATEADLMELAAEAGYHVQDAPAEDDAGNGPPATRALDGTSTRWALSIRRFDERAAIYCGSPYGRTESAGRGQVIVRVEVSTPSR